MITLFGYVEAQRDCTYDVAIQDHAGTARAATHGDFHTHYAAPTRMRLRRVRVHGPDELLGELSLSWSPYPAVNVLVSGSLTTAWPSGLGLDLPEVGRGRIVVCTFSCLHVGAWLSPPVWFMLDFEVLRAG